MNTKLDARHLQDAVGEVIQNQNSTNLKNLTRALNRFFKDSYCADVIYTKNLDKLFFGMRVMIYADKELQRYICYPENRKKEPIRNYKVEIDSKLLDLDLNEREITAILLHEVGHLVNNITPIEETMKAIDLYLAENNLTLNTETLKNTNSDSFNIILFAVNDTIRKLTSLFNRFDEEILADEFVFMCGYGKDLQSAFEKIKSNISYLSKSANVNKLIKLEWAIRVYLNMGISRLSAIKTLNRAKQLTGSEIEKEEITKTVNCLNNSDIYANESFIMESDRNDSFLNRVQRKGLKAIEEDLFMYRLRAKNIETEDDALFLMRQINYRMGILDDYIYNNKDNHDDYTLKKYDKLYNEYSELREYVLKRGSNVNSRFYGLFMDYGQFPDSNR